MNAPAGWYQDTQRSLGHLRYWDGSIWTEHRHTLPSPGAPMVPTASSAVGSRGGSWVRQHKVATAALLILGLALVSSVMPDEADPGPASATAQADDDDEGKGEAGRARSGSSTKETERERGRVGTPRDRSQRSASAGADESDKDRATTTVVAPKPKRTSAPTYYVSRIIDGDTIELGNGETVRLVGIDTPEVGECGFEAAAANLSSLILGRRVRLGMSDEDRDSYGRLLRYVNLGDLDAGMRLIKNGRAIAAYDSRDGYGFHPRETVYIANDRGARDLCPMQTGQQTAPAPVTPKPHPQPLMGGGGGGGSSCASGYNPCLPTVADLDCADVDGPVRVTGSDPYQLDADGDGVGCDS